eukprot:gene20516-26611_t
MSEDSDSEFEEELKLSDQSKSKKRINDLSIPVDEATIKKYARGSTDFKVKKSKYKGSRLTLYDAQEKVKEASLQAAMTEILLPDTKGYLKSENDSNIKLNKLKQEDIKKFVDVNTCQKSFELQLYNFGPYKLKYSRNGRFMAFCGRKGHISSIDCHNMKVGLELQLQEEVHDIQFLHDESMIAVAQNRFTYIYDYKGVEIHCLREHERALRLDFLPYHFLLTTIGQSGRIKWHDISTGTLIADHYTNHGPSNVLCNNPHNAVSHVGHRNGVVSLWAPSTNKALVSILSHTAPIADIAIHRDGHYMATSGYDGYLKIWDLRTFKSFRSYKLNKVAVSLDISSTGLVAVGLGREVKILHDPFSSVPETCYLQHELRHPNKSLNGGSTVVSSRKATLSDLNVMNVKFRPFEDILAIGHTQGISTIIVPGSGEANFDSFESNPYINRKQRREAEIQNLLAKLSPDMIALDTKFVGTVDKDKETLQKEQDELFNVANDHIKDTKIKNRMRGRNKISDRLRRKNNNVIDEQTMKFKEMLEKEKSEERNEKLKDNDQQTEKKFDPLDRFKKLVN